MTTTDLRQALLAAVGAWRHPVRRRGLSAAASGGLILAALVAGSGLGATIPSAALMTLAAVVAGADVATRGIRSLLAGHIGIELLVATAAAGALVIGEPWEAAAVTFLFAFGGWLENRALRRTRSSLDSLLSAAPDTATILKDGQAVEVLANDVSEGEVVLVRPGARIPVDGVVTTGAGTVDESAITGEPIPAEKAPGSLVYAGTLAESGSLQVRSTCSGAETTLARIVRRVEEAQETKLPAQRLIESFARWYTPGVLLLSASAFVLTLDAHLALTLLVISCPGALVVSIPVAVVAGIGRAARLGVLIRGGEHLERMAGITALAFDKTGTLTEGRPRLSRVVALTSTGVNPRAGAGGAAAATRSDAQHSPDEMEVLLWAARAEAGSDHPLGRPIVRAATALEDIKVPEALSEFPGKGIRATVDGTDVAVGSRRLMDEFGMDLGPDTEAALLQMKTEGLTALLVSVNGRVTGLLGLDDTLRPTSAEMVRELKDQGTQTLVLLTGDDSPAGAVLGRRLGLSAAHTGLLPDEKLEHIRGLQSSGHRVAMLGDGINDAPALAAADLGIAMGVRGSHTAIDTADLTLLTEDLLAVPRALRLARRTRRVMRQNLVIAMGTVAFLAAGVLMGHVHMAEGMLVHQASVLAVLGNGMRLLRA